MNTLRLSVTTYGHVFDPTPQTDALTLAERVEAMRRFHLRHDLAQRQVRDLERARAAAAAIRSRTPTGGPIARRLEHHLLATGDLDLALADLERELSRETKQDLRLWAPLKLADGARREDANVVHISCIVLELDRVDHRTGPLCEAVRRSLSAWFHLAHWTWSPTARHPKLRVILPLAQPLAPADHPAVWDHLDALVGLTCDRTGKALARAWALPAVPDPLEFDSNGSSWPEPQVLTSRTTSRAPTPTPVNGRPSRRDRSDSAQRPPPSRRVLAAVAGGW